MGRKLSIAGLEGSTARVSRSLAALRLALEGAKAAGASPRHSDVFILTARSCRKADGQSPNDERSGRAHHRRVRRRWLHLEDFRVLSDGSTAWAKVPEPKDAFVAVSVGVFDRLTWNTYSAYHVRADLLTGEELERHFTK